MGAGGLPFPTSNNAPLLIPGGYGNPTGANTGFNFGSMPNTGFNFPAYGSPTMGVGGGGTPFPASNMGPFTGTNLAGLNAGISPAWGQGYGTDLYNRLGTAYGRGAGQTIGNILSGGLYNPQVAAAYLNAQQPGIARGEASVLGAFGDAGARFSSAAALGLGDYESQVQLNQQQMLAQLYQNAQQQELSLLQNVLPTLHQERANEGGWINKAIGGVETAAGVALMATGVGGPLGAMLVSGGLGTLAGHPVTGGGGGGGSSDPNAWLYSQPSVPNVTAPTIPSAPSMPNIPVNMQSPTIQNIMQGAGGGALGGTDPFGATGGVDWSQFGGLVGGP